MRPIDRVAAFTRDILLVIARDGRIVDANPAALAAYGYTLEELCARSIVDLRAPETLDEVVEQMEQADLEGVLFTSRHRRKDGSIFACEVSSRAATVDGARVLVSVIRDVTRRLETEERLRKSEESFRSMVEHAPYGVIVHRYGLIAYVNRAMLQMLGYEWPEQLVGRVAIEVVAPSDRATARARLAKLASGVRLQPGEMHLNKASGGVLLVELVGLNVSFGGEPAVMAMVRDVTETRRLEAELRQSQKMEAIGRLAGGVAHDFNNLLTAILGQAELLREILSETPQAHRQAEHIHRAASRAAQLTSQLLALSRKQVLSPKILDVNATVSSMATMLRRLIGADVELTTRLDPAIARVRADPAQIEQVLLNLAVNARDAMPAGGRLELVTRAASVEGGDGGPVQAGSWVQIRVADSGHGMDAETRQHLFEPFFTTKPRGKGTGLGLSTVYGIVAQSGGHIEVESEPGLGTRFTIWLPGVEAPLSAPEPSPREVAHAQRGVETILLVEDDADVRGFLIDVLDTQGYRVLAARDGQEALALAARHIDEIDLLLTDIVMPRMSGVEVAARLATLKPALRVLYVSGHPGERVAGLLSDRFLQKPFSVGELARRVRETLDDAGGTSSPPRAPP